MCPGLSVEDLVRLRAYAIWVEEGEPEGKEHEHWERARREIHREVSVGDRDIDGHLAPGHVDKSARQS